MAWSSTLRTTDKAKTDRDRTASAPRGRLGETTSRTVIGASPVRQPPPSSLRTGADNSSPTRERAANGGGSAAPHLFRGTATNISVYARIRPTEFPSSCYKIDFEENRLSFNVPRAQVAMLINNQRDSYDFKFNRIFDARTNQEEVFEIVAKPVVLSAMDGINGTVFAYGQTGSGKTFTVTGDTQSTELRGIVPRSLELIFQEVKKRHDCNFAVSVSYVEIYNDNGYDLLTPARSEKMVHNKNLFVPRDEIPKVVMWEDTDDKMHIANLSQNVIHSEEEGMELLFLGDSFRAVSETAMNEQSSRSHCIFTINIQNRPTDSDVIKHSQLHLVDLAGSERVHKTGANGQVLLESCYINRSLHFLEQVIVGLQTGSPHIPYRNSLMTKMLKDSLGGSHKTCMVANMSVEQTNIDESISTSRFAQRVAMIKNDVVVNEEIDPWVTIARLKQEIRLLKQEIAFLKGNDAGVLTGDDRHRIMELIKGYLADPNPDAVLMIGDLQGIRFAFGVLKSMVNECDSRARLSLENELAARAATLDETARNLNSRETALREEMAEKEGEVAAARAAYDELMEAVRARETALNEREAATLTEGREATKRLDAVSGRESDLITKETELVARETAIAAERSEMAKREAAMAAQAKRHELGEKDRAADADAAAKREQALKSLVDTRDATIKQLESAAAAREAVVADLQRSVDATTDKQKARRLALRTAAPEGCRNNIAPVPPGCKCSVQ